MHLQEGMHTPWKSTLSHSLFMIFFCSIIKEIENIHLFNISSIANYLYTVYKFPLFSNFQICQLENSHDLNLGQKAW